jgi:hypothetical protein
VFPDRFRQGASEAKVVLALIDRDWLNVKEGNGKRRLDDPKDYVHLEIALALKFEGKRSSPRLSITRVFPGRKILQNFLKT